VRRSGFRDLGSDTQLILVALILGGFTTLFIQNHFEVVGLLFLAFILFLGFVFNAPVDWLSKSVVIGELRLCATGIESTIGGARETIRFIDISKARFIHDHVKGARLHNRDIEHTGIAQLLLDLRDGKTLTYTILVATWEQVPKVEELLRSFYMNRVDLQEYMGRQKLKTILFKHGRSFKEIQALKEEFNVKKF
jgi:hypothetical protein